jgi:hypothetical protein
MVVMMAVMPRSPMGPAGSLMLLQSVDGLVSC